MAALKPKNSFNHWLLQVGKPKRTFSARLGASKEVATAKGSIVMPIIGRVSACIGQASQRDEGLAASVSIQIIDATFSSPIRRASARTSRFWSSRS